MAIKDLTNKTFDSGITALKFIEVRNHSAYWLCKCHCGNTFITRGADLSNGHTSSCGCKSKKRMSELGKQYGGKTKKDLTGQRFGKLIAIEPTDKRDSNRSVIWKCQCDCGRIVELSTHVLKQGQQSCGCLRTKGELKIAQLLLQAGIPFETQKTFETCLLESGYPAKFDFYVDNKYLIEYDGIQHFDIRYGWNTKDNYQYTWKNDEIKNKWCQENHIPLIRIPYTEYENLCLEDLLIKD